MAPSNRYLSIRRVALGFHLYKVKQGRVKQEALVARSYRELLVWQKAKALAVQSYKGTANFPKTETYGLTSQIRCAAFQSPRILQRAKGD
jgi:hypothetical protein